MSNFLTDEKYFVEVIKLERDHDADSEVTTQEVLRNFPCWRPILKRNILRCRDDINTTSGVFERIKLKERFDYLVGEYKKYDSALKRISMRHEHKDKKDFVDYDALFLMAKGVDIQNFVSSLGIEQKKGMIKCPFHNEKTASCKIYKDSWHCFGCSEGGDIIDFYSKYYNCDFKVAVQELTKI